MDFPCLFHLEKTCWKAPQPCQIEGLGTWKDQADTHLQDGQSVDTRFEEGQSVDTRSEEGQEVDKHFEMESDNLIGTGYFY